MDDWPFNDVLQKTGITFSWNWVSILACAVVVSLLTLWGSWVVQYVRSPLRRYPGPYLAGWTNLWRLSVVWSGKYPLVIKKLHDKYGPVVRIGPNLVDLDYPELVKTLYGTNEKWRKTEFYHNNSVLMNGTIVYNMFSTTDPDEHARMKRPVAKFFSASSCSALEPHMDEVIGDLCDQLERRFIDSSGKPKDCDLGDWIGFCAWDLITSITLSRRYGYMDKGYDFDNTIADLDRTIDYFSVVGQIPVLDYFLDKNPILHLGPPNMANAVGVALGSMAARAQGKDPNYDPNVPDLLHHFMGTKAEHPDLVDDNTILSYAITPLVAGADTTAITIRAIFYFLLRNPSIYRKLEKDVLAAGLGHHRAAPYNAARSIPYLEAVVRESMRLHPAVPFPLERYVPGDGGGLHLPDGSIVPPGVAVGINPYIVSRNKKLWGDDADVFRPERWLQGKDESENAFRDRLRAMNAADLTFGAGARICAGRNLALMEMYKMVATIISRFSIELADPKREWTAVGRWFYRQTGIVVHLRPRAGKAA